MKKIVGLLLFLLIGISPLFAQNKDTLEVQIKDYFVEFGSTFSWRGTGTFYDRTNWDSSPYTQGQLKYRNPNNGQVSFIMNFRLLYPIGYDANYSPGYPMIFMMHGFGERANCWDSNCYYGTKSYDPNDFPTGATTSQINNLLNNDHNLVHGGKPHLDAVNLAGSKKPDDPTLNPRAFPGFVFFPQNQDGWSQDNHAYQAIRLLRLLLKKINVDQDRIYIHGLSDGGGGVYRSIKNADWLFAAGAPMSAVFPGTNFTNADMDSALTIPLWTFQGGQDSNPTQAQTENLVKRFTEKGGSIRYTLYPNLGHGTWNTAYAEPDFFTWLLSKRKSNIHVLFGVPKICGTTGQGVTLGLAQGFLAYQWERDGEIIPGATSENYIATLPGVYRARFSRVSATPAENEWNRWSDPVIVTEGAPEKPSIIPLNTTHKPGLDGNNVVVMKSSHKEAHYYWYKNGVPVSGISSDTLSTVTANNSAAWGTGAYTLVTASVDNCPSLPSDPTNLWMAGSSPISITAPTNFTGSAISGSSILLSWTDASPNEKGFEIWRRTSGTSQFSMITLTSEDIVSYVDQGLQANTTYEYKIRAVSNIARSNFAPNNSLNINLVVSTDGDTTPPTAPQNLIVASNTIDAISLSWEPSDDAGGIKQYIVYYGANSIETNSTQTTYTITGLPTNQAYSITVKAQDFGLNLSPPSNQVTGTTYVSGLSYMHSTGAWTTLTDPTLMATWINPEYTGTVPTFTIAPPYRTQEDFFNFKFDGYIAIDEGGEYRFRTTSDDGSMLYLHGFDPSDPTAFRIVNNDGTHGSQMVQSSWQELDGNQYYRIVVTFFEYTGGETLTVAYRGPDTNDNWVTIPASVLTTGTYVPPSAPNAPTNLQATSNGMTQINLTWQHNGGGSPQYEIYRSASLNGEYVVVNTVSSLNYTDINLIPGTTYYYKLKTIITNATSGFSTTANATTVPDSEIPSTPANLQLLSKTFTNVAFNWTASTDNVGVSGYEVLINGSPVDTVAFPTYLATELSPNTGYNFTVKAIDLSGNKSAASSTLAVTTNTPATFYSLASGNLNDTGTWKQNQDGSGDSPASFSYNGQYFIVSNRTTSSLGGSWNVEGLISKVIVPDGITLTVDDAFSGNVEVQGGATINMNYNSSPNFVSISPTSTFNFNNYNTIPLGSYGTVNINGSGNKNFQAGETIINGNLSIADGASLKGASGNGTTVQIFGNLTFNGTPGVVAADNAVGFSFAKNGTQTFTASGELDLFEIETSSNTTLNLSGSAMDIRLGSTNGGGLRLNNGSTFNVGNNNLTLRFASNINPLNENGKIAITGGDISLSSTSDSNSNLYFSNTQKTLGLLTLDLSGSGDAIARSGVDITEGIKVERGELNSGGNIRLMSNATQTAHIQEIENSGVITGDVIVQRYLNPKGKVYRYISTSVEGVTVADWQNYFNITGNFTGTSGGTAVSMYNYDEPTGGWKPYPPSGGTNQAPIVKGVGYAVYFYNGTTPVTVEVTGNPYQGNHSFSLDGGTGGGADDGWNLLGNPYASPIVWGSTGWTSSGIGSTLSVRDNPAGQFLYWDAVSGVGSLPGGRVAPGQAFWVQATNASPQLTITEAAKGNDQTIIYREEEKPTANFFTIRLMNQSNDDPAYIVLSPDGTDNYDKQVDAAKRPNSFFNLSTLSSDGTSLAINKASDSFCAKTIQLNIENAGSGSYTMAFEDLDYLKGIGSILFTDNFANKSMEVHPDLTYNFDITTDPASFGSDRFTVTLSRPSLDSSQQLTASDLCGGANLLVTIDNSQSGVEYYAINDGNEIISAVTEGTGGEIKLIVPTENLTTGENSIRAIATFKGCASIELPSSVKVNYTKAPLPVTTTSFMNVCQGYPASLKAQGAPTNGAYHWFDENRVEIGVTSDGEFITDPIRAEKTFYVSAATSNGCLSELTPISVLPEVLETPSISLENDTLFVTSLGDIQWFRNGQPISNAHLTWYTPTESGLYTAVVSLNSCSAESDPIEFLVTGVSPNPDQLVLSLNIYPNPTSAENINVRVTSREQSNAQVKLMDLVGKPLFDNNFSIDELNQGVTVRPVERLPDGIYFIIVNQGKHIVKEKVIVKN